MIKLDPELKQRWVAALRSGKYLQIQGSFKKNIMNYDTVTGDVEPCTGFCAMGVLYDVAHIDLNPHINPAHKRWDEAGKKLVEYEHEDDEFTDDFTDEAMRRRAISLVEDDIATLNDSGKTFAEIADYVEEKY